ncbi:hypothetical protein [Cohnella algarum]|uniref:hypothetical protein n=1 Tax=Cohnella algarum TaxID=2044859 RepID=UPI0019683A53|nr:hypothetical protein [Cohnella algarum]MBN2980917.1 hypothetical protein [Cohnella algarum]
MDFIQRTRGISVEITEKASSDWTKSNQAGEFHEKAGFDWTKSNEAQVEQKKSSPQRKTFPPTREVGSATPAGPFESWRPNSIRHPQRSARK